MLVLTPVTNVETPVAELDRLAAMVRRLRPDGRNPEPFYELRSEISGALTALSRRLVAPGITRPAPVPPPRLINGFARTCPACGKAFFTPTVSRRTCSNACPPGSLSP
jgi:hypothetical protein